MSSSLLAAIFRSWLSLIGALLTTVSAFTFLTLFVLGLVNPALSQGTPGIVAYLIVPPIFIVGLVLIPLGQWRLRRSGTDGRALVIDFNVHRTRLIALAVSILTVVNVGIVSTATYKGIETMDSVEFCGTACHSVMHPEYTAHQRAPHSKVKCTRCHVGSGAEYFVRGKATGVRQLISIFTKTYHRPIPAPVELRPGKEICADCHARRAEPDRLVVIDRFEEDEDNTWKKTVLLDRVAANHWHIDHLVRFRSDPSRRFIGEVERPIEDGGVRIWRVAKPPPDAGALLAEWRTMDCVDCHNRPAHTYERPVDAIDRALASGALDRTLPFLRREALRIVQLPFETSEAARAGIRHELHQFYDGRSAIEPARVDAAADALIALFERNVFPSMKVGWNTYPTFDDHEDDQSGCFRCHTSELEPVSGPRISGRCELCHVTIAEKEENPEILDSLSDE